MTSYMFFLKDLTVHASLKDMSGCRLICMMELEDTTQLMMIIGAMQRAVDAASSLFARTHQMAQDDFSSN